MKPKGLNQTEKLSDEEAELVKILLHYPSLEKIFDRAEPQNLPEFRRKTQSTIADAERVIRRGTGEEAARAARVLAACQIVIGFLEELEQARRAQMIG